MSLLIERPSYVYEIARRYDDRYGRLLPVADATIYREMDALQADGLVERIGGAVGSRQMHYRATSAGARAFRESLRDLNATRPIELVTRMLAAAAVGGARPILAIVDAFEREALAEATRQPPIPTHAEGPAEETLAVLGRLVVEERRLAIGAQLKWVQYARAELRALEKR